MNKLEEIAEKERAKLKVMNVFKETSDEYSENHDRALSDGDDHGKGETTTIGSKTDIKTRSANKIKNKFNETNVYNGQ